MIAPDQPTQQEPKQPQPSFPMPGTNVLYLFSPKEDITVGELCDVFRMCITALISGPMGPKMFDVCYERLPEKSKRHFEVHKKPSIVVASRG